MNPQPPREELDNHYSAANGEALITHYTRVVTPSVIAQYNQTLSRIEQRLPGKGRLLDLACAAGHFCEQALKRGWETHGADLGEWVTEAARGRGLSNVHVGTLETLNFPDGHFDVVHAAQLLEHLPDPRADLAAIRRIVRPGGLIYVDVPNYHTLSIRLGRDDFWLNKPPEHLNYFTPSTLRHLLKTAGFEDIRLESGGGLKWENLLGWTIRRDVSVSRSEGAANAPPPPDRLSLRTLLREVVKAALIEPLFYRGLKVGICLAATARRPQDSVTE
jgi:SAM-dependent methyltransferase